MEFKLKTIHFQLPMNALPFLTFYRISTLSGTCVRQSGANGLVLEDIGGTGVITNNEVDTLIPTEDEGLTASLNDTDDTYIYQSETYYYDFFALPADSSLDAGDIVTVSLSSDDFDPILMILDAEGNVLEYNDNANEDSTLTA